MRYWDVDVVISVGHYPRVYMLTQHARYIFTVLLGDVQYTLARYYGVFRAVGGCWGLNMKTIVLLDDISARR